MEIKPKQVEYAGLIMQALNALFDEESDQLIDLNELFSDDNLTDFIHAMANLVPTTIYNKLTDENLNLLEHNQVATKLIFQFHSPDNKQDKTEEQG